MIQFKKIFLCISFFTIIILLSACIENEITITLVSNGGIVDSDTIVLNAGDDVQLSSPTKDGFSFDGWFVDDTLVSLFSTTRNFDTDTTLYASWTKLIPVTLWNMEYDDSGILNTRFNTWESFNPHTVQESSTLEYFELVTDTLYIKDYDWELSISKGLATEEYDFTNHQDLSRTFIPSMASSEPEQLTDYTWKVTLNEGLTFSNGDPITAETFLYSYKMLLDPVMLNANASLLFSDSGLQIENAEKYYSQNLLEEVNFNDVGIHIDDTYTIVFTLNNKISADYLKSILSMYQLSVVNETLYESGLNMTKTKTTYGEFGQDFYSYGPYNLNVYTNTTLNFTKRPLSKYTDTYLIPEINMKYYEEDSNITFSTQSSNLDILSDTNLRDIPSMLELQYPSSTLMSYNLNADYLNDSDPSNDNPYLGYYDFRLALYYAMNTGSYNSNLVSHDGFINDVFTTSLTSSFNHRQLDNENNSISKFIGDFRYSTVLAQEHFNKAYTQMINDGLITDGDVISISLAYYDIPLGFVKENSYKKDMETILGAHFNLNLDGYSSQSLSIASSTYAYDMILQGWNFNNSNSIDALHYYYMVQNFEDTNDIQFNLNLPQLKIALNQMILNEEDFELKESYQLLLDMYSNDMFTGSAENAVNLYQFASKNDYYEIEDDLYTITSSLESKLFTIMPRIPIGSNAKTYFYSGKVGLPSNEFNPFMSYGTFKYMYLKLDN